MSINLKLILKNIVFFLSLFFISLNAQTQTTEDIKKEADALFKKEQFLEATPLYLQLLNVEPRNHELNYKYGACLIYSAQDKSESIRFLNFSVKSNSIDPKAHFFLGKAYHLNFQFSKAIASYQKFKSLASQSDQKKFNIEANLSACRNGKQLLSNITDMIVIEKTEVKKQDFYELYKLDNIGGSLLVTDQFQTKIDKKNGHRPIIYFPQDSPYIFYSSYGETGETGLDIYVKEKLPNGKWTDAIKVVGDVNTDLDEDYPYLSLDGKYLYYSSKGHNSMGGYDVFRSKVIIEGSSFSKPENMDFAISSPNDDILYIVDSLDRNAYFSSARESQDGKLYVYQVRVEKIPMQLAVLKGDFLNEIDPGNRSVEIEVSNFSTGKSVGTFNSTPGNGSIILTIPKSGKYTFDMTVKGNSITHRAEVSIPYLKEFRPLKIDLLHKMNNGQEVIVLKTLFDEEFEDPTAIMASVYQRISKLDPNAGKYNLDSLNNIRSSDDVFLEAGIDAYNTPADIEVLLKDAIEDVATEKEQLESKSFMAHNIADEKQRKAVEKLEEAKLIIEEAQKDDNPASKNNSLTKAYRIVGEAQKLNNDAQNLVRLGQRIEKEIKIIEDEEVAINSSLLAIKAVDQNDGEGLISFVKTNKSTLATVTNTEKNKNILDEIENAGNDKRKELNDLKQEISDLEARQNVLQNSIESANTKILNTKKNKDKEVIESEIQSYESELDLVKSEILKNQGKLDRFTESEMKSIAMVEAVSEIRSESNQSEENKTPVSNTQKLKISYAVEDNEFLSGIKDAEAVFRENNISGESINLTGLNESMIQATDFSSIKEVEDRINEVLNELENTDEEADRKRLEKDLERLNQIKEEKIKESTIVIDNNKVKKSDILSDYNERKSDILALEDIAEQKESLAKLDSELLVEVEKAIKKSKKSGDASEQYIESLNEIKNETENSLEDYEDWKIAKSNASNSAEFTYQDALTSVNENYEDRIKAIYNNSALTDDEKAEDLKALNNTTLTTANEKLQEIDAKLSADPNDDLAKKQKRQISRLVNELENNAALPLIEPAVESSLVAENKPIKNDNLLPNYSEKIKNVENSGINELDKEKAKLNINKELLTKVNNEIQIISSDPELEKSKKKELEELQKLQDEIKDEIVSSEAIIEKKIEESPDLENSVESIVANYTSQSYQINELNTDAEKIEAIKALNETAIQEIEKEITKTKIANAANPREELRYELAELENLKKEIQYNNERDYYGVVILDSDEQLSEVRGAAGIYDIVPDYQLRKEAIEQDAISKKDLERKKLVLNETTLAKVEQEVRRLKNGINTTPGNKKQLTKRAASLEEIAKVLEERIFESKAILGEDPLTFDVVVDVEDVNPDYTAVVAEIKTYDDKTEKAKAVRELNKETVGLIEEKITLLDEDLEKNGFDRKKVQMIQKYNSLVAEIEANPDLPAKGSVNTVEVINGASENSEKFPVIYKSVAITEALPNYESDLDSINNMVASTEQKEAAKIDLYNNSIDQLKLQSKELETYNRIDSPNKEYAEEKLKNLEEIINVLENEVKISRDKISNIRTPKSYSNLADIMPDYDTRREKIEYESTTTVEKLAKLNELNKVLLFEIETKVEELESLQNDSKSETRTENIKKLNELADVVSQEIASAGNVLEASEADVDLVVINENKFEPLNPDNFEDDLEVNQLNLIKKDVKLIKKFENDIIRLNRKKARLTGNEADKIDKQINKLIDKQSTLHNRLISDLEIVIDEKLQAELSDAKENSVQIKGAGMKSDEIRNAEEGILIAEAKIEKAKEYRKEALGIKNQVVANKILLKAAQLEYEAQQLLEKSNLTLRTASIVSELADEQAIIEVSQLEDDRVSTALYELAADFDRDANIADNRASFLADSVLTVKKKYRQAIVLEMEQLQEQAAILRSKADDLRIEAEDIEEKEIELLSAKPEKASKDVPKTDQIVALNSNSYSDYYDEISVANENMANAKAVNLEIEELKEKAAKIIRKAIVLNPDSKSSDYASDPEVMAILEEIDALVEKRNTYRQEAIAHFNAGKDILNKSSDSDNIKENMVILAQRGVEPNTQIELSQSDIENTATAAIIDIQASNPIDNTGGQTTNDNQNLDNQSSELIDILPQASTDFVPPSKLNGQLFRITDKAVYSTDNPIPVNAKQPEGLVYKVQVGAFRNPLPPQSFDKFAPISGQELSSGVTRYMVGYFTNFEPANNAKTEIRGIGGYNDAFVVAYFNGERITISRARELEENGVIPVSVPDNNSIVDNSNVVVEPVDDNSTANDILATQDPPVTNQNQTNTTSDPILTEDNAIVKPVSDQDRAKADYYLSVPDAAPASQVEIIDGLFYTVQIGVYSQPVPSSELFDVSPLNSQLTKSGKIRYSTGIYTMLDDAVSRKNEMIEIGIVDAFVTAYFNGNRISIVESKNILAENGADVLTQRKTTSEVEGDIPNLRYKKENVYYRILLGKYENAVPSDVANYLFNDDNIFFETEIDADNSIYLYTQKFKDLSEVKKRLVEINELGFEDMEILSYYNLLTIPFDQAQKIVNSEEVQSLDEYDYPKGIGVDDIYYQADAIYYRANVNANNEAEVTSIIEKLNTIVDEAFEREVTEDGKIIIHSENKNSFAEAERVLSLIKQTGVNNGIIAAYHKYVQISVEKALEIKGK